MHVWNIMVSVISVVAITPYLSRSLLRSIFANACFNIIYFGLVIVVACRFPLHVCSCLLYCSIQCSCSSLDRCSFFLSVFAFVFVFKHFSHIWHMDVQLQMFLFIIHRKISSIISERQWEYLQFSMLAHFYFWAIISRFTQLFSIEFFNAFEDILSI